MIELLYFEGCPSAAETETLLRRVLAEEGRTTSLIKIAVETSAQAATTRFLGSPTIRVNGRDIEPARADEPGGAMSCRLYRTERGESGVPPEALLRAAVRSLAHGDAEATSPAGGVPARAHAEATS
jgi:hypothetical protein